jgi:chromosome segregation ATPase
MPRRRTKDIDMIEQDFLDALERLQGGRPQNPELRKRLRTGKSVKVNILNVAKEAGRARGLIAEEDCRLPAVRNLVLAAAGREGVQPGNLNDVIKHLRAEVALLRAELADAKKHAAWHLSERHKAESQAQRLQAQLKRIRENADQRSSKVIPFYVEGHDN